MAMWSGYCSAEALAEPLNLHLTGQLLWHHESPLLRQWASVTCQRVSGSKGGWLSKVTFQKQGGWQQMDLRLTYTGGYFHIPFHCTRFLSALQSVSVLVLDCLNGRKRLLEGGFQELLSSPHPHSSLLLCWYSKCPCLVTRQQTPASCTEPGH